MFYNTYGYEPDDAGRKKALGDDYKDVFFNASMGESAAPMEEDDSSAADVPSPAEMREKATPAKTGNEIQGMVIGALGNSYLMRGSEFDVMRNVEGGVEDSGGLLHNWNGLQSCKRAQSLVAKGCHKLAHWGWHIVLICS